MRLSLSSPLSLSFDLSFTILSLFFPLMHFEQHTELDNLIAMQNLRTFANKGSNDAYDVSVSLTAMMGVAVATKDELAVMLVVQYVAYVRPRSGHPSSARVGREQLGSPHGTSGGIEGLENCRVRRKCSAGRTPLGRPRPSFDQIHNGQSVCDTSLEPNSDKIRLGFCQMGRSCWSKRDHNSPLLSPSRRSVVRCGLANPIVAGNSKARQMAQHEKCQEVLEARSAAQGNLEAAGTHAKVWTTGGKPRAAASQWRTATSSARVDHGSQPRVILESRCRAKLHGIFKHAQRRSRDGRFFWHLLRM